MFSPGWDVSYSAINCLTILPWFDPYWITENTVFKTKTKDFSNIFNKIHRISVLSSHIYQQNFAVNFTSRNLEKVPSEQIL